MYLIKKIFNMPLKKFILSYQSVTDYCITDMESIKWKGKRSSILYLDISMPAHLKHI